MGLPAAVIARDSDYGPVFPSPGCLYFREIPSCPQNAAGFRIVLVYFLWNYANSLWENRSRSGCLFRVWHCAKSCPGRYFRDTPHRVLSFLLSPANWAGCLLGTIHSIMETDRNWPARIPFYQNNIFALRLRHRILSGKNCPYALAGQKGRLPIPAVGRRKLPLSYVYILRLWRDSFFCRHLHWTLFAPSVLIRQCHFRRRQKKTNLCPFCFGKSLLSHTGRHAAQKFPHIYHCPCSGFIMCR